LFWKKKKKKKIINNNNKFKRIEEFKINKNYTI